MPLKQVHRIIEVGLLGDAARGGNHARATRRDGLVGQKLAHGATKVLTLEGRRRHVRFSLDHPGTIAARTHRVSAEVKSGKCYVRKGQSLLARAREAVSCDNSLFSETLCIAGTRIPVYDIANMIANVDNVGSIRGAFPQLSQAQIELATFYPRISSQQDRPRRQPFWQ